MGRILCLYVGNSAKLHLVIIFLPLCIFRYSPAAGTTIMRHSGKQFEAGKWVSHDKEQNLLYAVASGIVRFTPVDFLPDNGGYIVSIQLVNKHYPIPELKEYQDFVFGPPKSWPKRPPPRKQPR